MTQKRFIKLLMAKGYDRNEANQIAKDGKKGQTYAERYFLISFYLDFPDHMESISRLIDCICTAIVESVKPAIEAIIRIAQAVTDATPGIIENIRRLQAANEGMPSE